MAPMDYLRIGEAGFAVDHIPPNRMVGYPEGPPAARLSEAHDQRDSPRIDAMPKASTSLTHWGAFTADVRDGDIASVRPFNGDADPSPLLG
ncbi:MAG: hypothetical protein ACRDUX_36055, partial [Mycobacterium sp.]